MTKWASMPASLSMVTAREAYLTIAVLSITNFIHLMRLVAVNAKLQPQITDAGVDIFINRPDFLPNHSVPFQVNSPVSVYSHPEPVSPSI